MITRTLRFWQTSTKAIPKAKNYVNQFQSLQIKLKEQEKQIEELEKQNELAERANAMTLFDHVRQLISKITKSKFESEALTQLKLELIQYRNQLQNKIEESDKRWEKPREQILRIRQEIQTEFLTKFALLDLHLQKTTNMEIQSSELKEGCELTYRLLLSILGKHGVEFFKAEEGTPFDPLLHQTADKEQAGKQIKEVLSEGWKIGGKVIKKPCVRL